MEHPKNHVIRRAIELWRRMGANGPVRRWASATVNRDPSDYIWDYLQHCSYRAADNSIVLVYELEEFLLIRPLPVEARLSKKGKRRKRIDVPPLYDISELWTGASVASPLLRAAIRRSSFKHLFPPHMCIEIRDYTIVVSQRGDAIERHTPQPHTNYTAWNVTRPNAALEIRNTLEYWTPKPSARDIRAIGWLESDAYPSPDIPPLIEPENNPYNGRPYTKLKVRNDW